MAPLWDNHDNTSDVLHQQEVCLAGNIVKELAKRLFCVVRIQRAARLSQLARRHMLDITEYCRFLPDDDVELVCLRFVWIVQEPSRCNHCCLEGPGLSFALCFLLLLSSRRELKSRLSGFPGPAPPRTLQNMTARKASNWTMRLVPSAASTVTGSPCAWAMASTMILVSDWTFAWKPCLYSVGHFLLYGRILETSTPSPSLAESWVSLQLSLGQLAAQHQDSVFVDIDCPEQVAEGWSSLAAVAFWSFVKRL